MPKRIGKYTVKFECPPTIESFASSAGKKEAEGPLGKMIDNIFDDEYLGKDTFEEAESQLQYASLESAMKKAGIKPEQINYIFAGDLLNQCAGSTFGLCDFSIPHIGIYSACATFALGIGLAASFVDGGIAKRSAVVTSSHFCASERQFRFPLEYGGQRTPTSQWTVTGSGAVILSNKREDGIKVKSATIGKIIDLGVTDVNNMGAAMAPDDVKIRPYPKLEGMVFFYTQIYIKGG